MPRNYDTTNGLPYPRVTRIVIDYPESGIPLVEYTEHTAIVDSGGTIRRLNDVGQRIMLQVPPPNEPVQVINPATDADIPGVTTTVQQTMLGITALIRRDQKRRDQPPPAPAPAPEGEGEPEAP